MHRVYQRIDHNYLEQGHAYLKMTEISLKLKKERKQRLHSSKNDRDFTPFEKRKKTAFAFLTQDWLKIIRESNVTNLSKWQKWSSKTVLIGKVSSMTTSWPQIIRRAKKVLLKDVHYMKFQWGEKGKRKSGNEAWPRWSLGEIQLEQGWTMEETKNCLAKAGYHLAISSTWTLAEAGSPESCLSKRLSSQFDHHFN